MFTVSGDKIFLTVQGEGPSLGRPAVFLRLHHCNLQCSWCDAWYTWKRGTKEFQSESSQWSIDDVADEIKRIAGSVRLLVITGGEPLIQHRSIERLLKRLPDWDVEIETNGTIMPPPGLCLCTFNCSPKLSNSGKHGGRKRIVPDVLKRLDQLDTTFKFVVSTELDIAEIERDYLPYISRERVLLMPEGTDAETINRKLHDFVGFAVKRNFRVTTRLQVLLWGSERRR